MNKPICEFLEKYNSKNPIRLHVPGHKGKSFLGYEKYDLTEVDGADELYLPTGIIKESQQNASRLFNCPTYYSVEGSSHAIRAMLYLAKIFAKERGIEYNILATRNVHKSFLSGCALLGANVNWIENLGGGSYYSNYLTPEILENYLKSERVMPCALYVTSPDYLGNILDISGISKVLKKYGILFLVDNAHGAYLNFLDMHPISLGASMCADSAHKTLPVLTGGAYLHLSNEVYNVVGNYVQTSLSLFGTTSPSYLILSSLDSANAYLNDGYKTRLKDFIKKIDLLKQDLISFGYDLLSSEPLKITIDAKNYGYVGEQIVKILIKNDIYVEFYDDDYVVLMLTPELIDSEIEKVKQVLLSICKKTKIEKKSLPLVSGKRVLSLTEASASLSKIVDTKNSLGEIYQDFNLPCPPAVPIIMPGEEITLKTIEVFNYYNIKTVKVVK